MPHSVNPFFFLLIKIIKSVGSDLLYGPTQLLSVWLATAIIVLSLFLLAMVYTIYKCM